MFEHSINEDVEDVWSHRSEQFRHERRQLIEIASDYPPKMTVKQTYHFMSEIFGYSRTTFYKHHKEYFDPFLDYPYSGARAKIIKRSRVIDVVHAIIRDERR